MTRFIKAYPLPIIVGGGLALGLATHAVFPGGGTAAGRWILLGTVLAGGGPLVVQTVAGMLRGRFAADIVATLAIVTAVVLGQYFAGAVIALMQSGGGAVERYAMGRASNALEALLARAPKIARRMTGQGLVED